MRPLATAYTAKQQPCLQSALFCFESAHPGVSSQQQAARNHDPGCLANVFQPKNIDIDYVSWRHPCTHNAKTGGNIVTPCYPNLSPHLRSPSLRAPVTEKTYRFKQLYTKTRIRNPKEVGLFGHRPGLKCRLLSFCSVAGKS